MSLDDGDGDGGRGPFLSFSRLTDDVLMRETVRRPRPMSITTSLMTGLMTGPRVRGNGRAAVPDAPRTFAVKIC